MSSYSNVVLAVHGGTGIDRTGLTPALEADYRKGLAEALRSGFEALRAGKTSLDAVETAVRSLEDCPLFNAGRGAVFTRDGQTELDAAIMEGLGHRAGGVGMVTTIKNPISAARAVMEKSPHVLLVASGAEAFAKAQGLEQVDPSYFHTDRRRRDLEAALAKKKTKKEWGTVGAVARDANGLLSAATSTGGMTAKWPGRIGDSPLIGAGTYADNATCAVSATGQGEFFMRTCLAHSIAARMRFGGASVDRAAKEAIEDTLARIGGEGGVIALDAQGKLAMPYNSAGLYRGFITREGEFTVLLYEE